VGRTPDESSDDLETEDSLSFFDLSCKEISFLDRSMNCCIAIVDMINSTKVTAEIFDRRKIGQYYSIFINTMAVLAKNHGAKIIKNAGDSLIFYFPESSDSNEPVLKEAFEGFTKMILARGVINAKLNSENLPSVNYRISADYGRVEVATSSSSKGEDLFGSTMNICAKINSMAEPNGLVIGGDLYRIIKSFSFIKGYELRELEGCHIGFNHSYPVYRAYSKHNESEFINSINCLFDSPRISKMKNIQARQKQSSKLFGLSQQRQHQQSGFSANIMLVDDELDALLTYEQFLSDEGHNVESFTDSTEALNHFVQLPHPSSYYNLAILDIRMPRLNGLQLFNKLKTLSPQIKVIFCSALEIAEELTSLLPEVKYDYIIKKPIERDHFVSKINSALKQ
jgi:two-component system response regulator ChvI